MSGGSLYKRQDAGGVNCPSEAAEVVVPCAAWGVVELDAGWGVCAPAGCWAATGGGADAAAGAPAPAEPDAARASMSAFMAWQYVCRACLRLVKSGPTGLLAGGAGFPHKLGPTLPPCLGVCAGKLYATDWQSQAVFVAFGITLSTKLVFWACGVRSRCKFALAAARRALALTPLTVSSAVTEPL